MRKTGKPPCSRLSPGFTKTTPPQILKFNRVTLFVMMLFLYVNLLAQNTPLSYRIEYKQTVKTYYTVANPVQAFSGPEMVKLRNTIVSDSVVKEVDINHDIITTIFHIENNKMEEWMTKPAKTVISKDEVILYDEYGGIITESKHSEKQLKNYDAIKSAMALQSADIIPEFLSLTQDLTNELIAAGFQYEGTGTNSATFIKDSIELHIDNDQLTYEIICYTNSDALLTSLKKGFVKNQLGQIVPGYIIKKFPDERFQNDCVQKVEITDYDNYRITYDNYRNLYSTANDQQLVIYPNPVDGNLRLYLSEDYFSDATIEIYDASGNLIMKKYFPEVDRHVNVNSDALTPGVYIIRIYNNYLQFNKTFYKN